MRCPSAMKCVPKVNCDFEGVMTEEVLELGPELEMLRVPLIVSSAVNRAANEPKFLLSRKRPLPGQRS